MPTTSENVRQEEPAAGRREENVLLPGAVPINLLPDAHIFYLQLEDIKLILTKGVSKHGEWFFSGSAFRGKVAMQTSCQGSRDRGHRRGARTSTLPDHRLDHMIAYTDGCQAQFGGRNSFGRVAEQLDEDFTEVLSSSLSQRRLLPRQEYLRWLVNVSECASESRAADVRPPWSGARAQVRPNLPFFSLPSPRLILLLACPWSKQVLFLAENVKGPAFQNKKPDWWAVYSTSRVTSIRRQFFPSLTLKLYQGPRTSLCSRRQSQPRA